jgi:antitoxin (DNA-binding transcriptional repressor) of toxin-antitoxin stability system
MKRVTASDARKNWFRLLDEVVAGEVVVVERSGRRIVIQRDADEPAQAEAPDYADLIRAPDAEEADGWGWEWDEASGGLGPTDLHER